MKWTKITVKTTTEAEDIIISTLYDIGLEGAQIEDNIPLTALEKEQMFVDILPETKFDDGIAYLSFFVEELISNRALKLPLNHTIAPSPSITTQGTTSFSKAFPLVKSSSFETTLIL